MLATVAAPLAGWFLTYMVSEIQGALSDIHEATAQVKMLTSEIKDVKEEVDGIKFRGGVIEAPRPAKPRPEPKPASAPLFPWIRNAS